MGLPPSSPARSSSSPSAAPTRRRSASSRDLPSRPRPSPPFLGPPFRAPAGPWPPRRRHPRLRRDGVLVAIKVQRPGIVALLERDLSVIKMLSRLAQHMPGSSHVPWDGLVRELRRVFTEEVDYRYEVSNLRRLRKTLREHNVYVPKVYRRLSGRQIIVMELIEGVLMSDYSRIQATDPTRAASWCEENNVEPRKVGSRLMRSFYRQMFEDNVFHGDLHPGNIVLLRDSRFALIDLGSIGTL